MHKGKVFRDEVVPLDLDDRFPPTLREYIPERDRTRLVDEIIDAMELPDLMNSYLGGGAPAYHPKMLLKLHIMGLMIGMPSARKIAIACRYDTRFMYLARKATPNHRTISTFRRGHKDLGKQVLKETIRISMALGLVDLEEASVDGSKLEADVSGKATYSPTRREKEEAKLEAIAKRLSDEALRIDANEDQDPDPQGDNEMPEELTDPEERKRQIAKAMASVKAQQERNAKAKVILEETGEETVGVTDTDSRVMKTKSGNRSAYNCQAAVDAKCQIIVAACVTQDVNDVKQLGIVLDEVVENTGQMPQKVAVDTGYNSEESFAYAEQKGVDAYIAPRPEQITLMDYEYDAENDLLRGCTEATLGHELRYYREREHRGHTYQIYRDPKVGKRGTERWFRDDVAKRFEQLSTMQRKMRTAKGRAVYRKRQYTIEPVFAFIKGPLGTRRLLLRGMTGATIQFLLACCCHNICKIAASIPQGNEKWVKTCLEAVKNRLRRAIQCVYSGQRRHSGTKITSLDQEFRSAA